MIHPKTLRNQDPVDLYINGRAVATVIGNVLRKTIRDEHLNRNPPGIGWAVETLDEAERLGATIARVHYGSDTYVAPLNLIRQVGLYRGFAGWQIILPLVYWSINGNPPTKTPRSIPVTATEAEAAQLSLFAGVQP